MFNAKKPVLTMVLTFLLLGGAKDAASCTDIIVTYDISQCCGVHIESVLSKDGKPAPSNIDVLGLYRSILGEQKGEGKSSIRKIPFGESKQLTCTFDSDGTLTKTELNTMVLINNGKQFKWSKGKPIKIDSKLLRELKGNRSHFTICY